MRWLIVLFLALGVWIQPSTSQATEVFFKWSMACNNAASVVAVIKASHNNTQGEVFFEEVNAGRCKSFGAPRYLGVQFIKVVREDLKWGDGDPMFVIEGQDKSSFRLFVWMPKSTARDLGIDGPVSQPI